MLNPQQIKELSTLQAEYTTLANKSGRFTKEDESKATYLRRAMKSVENGVSLQEFDRQHFNERSLAAGLPVTKFKKTGSPFLTEAQVQGARGWQALVKGRIPDPSKNQTEQRTGLEGALYEHFGTYTSLGYFCPTGFVPELKAALAAVDALFDPDVTTRIDADNGRIQTWPIVGDIENIATIVNEAGSLTPVDYSVPGQAVIGVYGFKSPVVSMSTEAFDDQNVNDTFNAIENFKQIAYSRVARGIGAMLVQGEGYSSGEPQGLLTSLLQLGVPNVVASGSSVNDGSSANGTNSLGSQDFAQTLDLLNQAFVDSEKCAWFMNSKTLSTVRGIVTKMGSLLELVKDVDGVPTIYGIPVRICPSMPNIGVSNTPVILGDGSYFAVKLVQDDKFGIKVYRESTGLIEQGIVQARMFVRAGSALLYNDLNSPSPFVTLSNFS